MSVMITIMQSKLKINLWIARTETSFCCQNHAKFSVFSKDGAIVKSYGNHVSRIIEGHFAEKNRERTITDYFQSLQKSALKEQILPYYQNSWFFSNFQYFEHLLIRINLPCPLRVRINGWNQINRGDSQTLLHLSS